MKHFDKMLFGIIAAVILLVIVAFAVAFLRPKPTYQSEETPGGVVHNYLLALRQRDFERAYTYLSPTIAGYPISAKNFTEDVSRGTLGYSDGDDSTTMSVDDTTMLTPDLAEVTVGKTHFYEGGLFDSNQYTNECDLTLQRKADSGEWKIIDGDYGCYWSYCWDRNSGCP